MTEPMVEIWHVGGCKFEATWPCVEAIEASEADAYIESHYGENIRQFGCQIEIRPVAINNLRDKTVSDLSEEKFFKAISKDDVDSVEPKTEWYDPRSIPPAPMPLISFPVQLGAEATEKVPMSRYRELVDTERKYKAIKALLDALDN